MQKLKILIIGNTTSSGHNLQQGLLKYHNDKIERVDLVFKESQTLTGFSNSDLLVPEEYDIVLYSYPFFKTYLKYYKYITKSKVLICWWRGSDLRLLKWGNPITTFLYRSIQSLFISWIFKRADYHLYSTYDLRWFLRSVPNHKKLHAFQIIDTEIFKDLNYISRNGTVYFENGSRNRNLNINHNSMPEYLNKYKFAEVVPAESIDPNILSVTALECLACGLIVKYHEDKNRDFVINHCSIKVRSKEMLDLFLKFVGDK